MSRNYNELKDYSEYQAPCSGAVAIPTNDLRGYLHHFFPYIDLSYILKWMQEVDPEGKDYTMRIVDGYKLQLIDGSGQVVSEIEIPGASAIIPEITASATVNAATGTPAVTVSRTGPDDNPNFNFAFENLKGEKGDKGEDSTVPGPAGADGQNGRPFAILGKYPTYEAMIAAHPVSEAEVGDAYQVGEPDEYYTKTEVDDLLDEKADKSEVPDVTNYYTKTEVNSIVDDIRQVPTGGNNGDVLTKATTGPMWAPPVKELPAISSGDAGKVLGVNAGETGVEWITPQGGGGDSAMNIPFNPHAYIGEIYDSGGTKVFDRNVDSSFDFVSGTTYNIRLFADAVKTPFDLKGKCIFLGLGQYMPYRYVAIPGTFTEDFSSMSSYLSGLGSMKYSYMLPDKVDVDTSYYDLKANLEKTASIKYVRESTDVNNVVYDKLKIIVNIYANCTYGFTYEPDTFYEFDINALRSVPYYRSSNANVINV